MRVFEFNAARDEEEEIVVFFVDWDYDCAWEIGGFFAEFGDGENVFFKDGVEKTGFEEVGKYFKYFLITLKFT